MTAPTGTDYLVTPERLRCNGNLHNRWGYAGRCWRVGTVPVRGKLYCLTCARAASTAKESK